MRTAPWLTLLAALISSPTLAQAPVARTPTVSVTGTGDVEVKPDFARMLVLVSTPADTLEGAVDANRVATERVLARLQAAGLRREDIRTVNLQTFPTPTRYGNDGREIAGPRFTANHQLRITTRDIEGVGRLTGEIATIDGLNLQSLAWSLDRKDRGTDLARRSAVEDARRQAALYAEAAGVKLGRLIEIRDGATHLNGGLREDSAMALSARAAEPIPVIPPAMLSFTASIEIVWEIAP